MALIRELARMMRRLRDRTRCRYEDCPEAHPCADGDEGVTCPVCREWMGLDP